MPNTTYDLRAELEHAAHELEMAENALACSSFHSRAERAKKAARRARAVLGAEPAGNVRYEFIVSDALTDEPQAGGEAPTLEEAQREGNHYLAMYEEDGPMRLELLRVEVLP